MNTITITNITTFFVAIMLLQSAYASFLGDTTTPVLFGRLELGSQSRVVIGIIELIAAILLFVPGLTWLGAVIAGLLVVVAGYLYISSLGATAYLLLVLVVLAATAWILWANKQQIPLLNVANETRQQITYNGERNFENWEKPSEEELREKLQPLQFQVTQRNGTEPPFANAYRDNKQAGIYVDIISGEPLFSSTHKYRSGTGWPTFWRPIESGAVTEHEDTSLRMTRTEIRSAHAGSHIGHVFTDGPEDKTGLRYCMNSAALKFIPKEEMAENGYEDYLYLFDNENS